MVENVLGGGVGGDTMGIVGGEVDLECYTIGTPTPTLTWEKDDGVREDLFGSVWNCILFDMAGDQACAFGENRAISL